MKIQFVKIRTLALKESVPGSKRALDDDDVEERVIYLNPQHITMLSQIESDMDKLPLTQSRICVLGGFYWCADTVEDLIEQIQAIEFIK